MTAIINAAPRAILRGVQDLSGRPPVYEPEALPQHLPHIFLYTERGTGVPQITIGDGLNKIYGAKSFDLRLKAGEGGYATHQTLLATVMSQNANQMLVQRLLPTDAAVARFRLSVDVLNTNGPVLGRANDGSVISAPEKDRGSWNMSVSGNEMPDITGLPTVEPVSPASGAKWNDISTGLIKYYSGTNWVAAGKAGSGTNGAVMAGDYWLVVKPSTNADDLYYRANANAPGTNIASGWGEFNVAIKSLAWIVDSIDDDIDGNTTFGAGAIANGVREDSDFPGVMSRKIPVMDFEVSSAGKWGNGAGIRFSAPNSESAIPFDTRLVAEQLTTMFRMSVVEKESEIVSPKIIETRYGEQYIDFSLKPNAVDERNSQEIYLPMVFNNNYIDNSTVPPTFGTFSDVYVYESNIDSLVEELYMHERYILKNELSMDVVDIDDILPNPNGFGNYKYKLLADTSLTGAAPLIQGANNLTGETDVVVFLSNQTPSSENGYYRYQTNAGGTAYTLTRIEADGRYTVNFFTGVAWNTYQYESIRMLEGDALTAINGVNMRSTDTQWALGGADGTMSVANFNLLVADQCKNYGDLIVKRNPNGDADPADVPLDFMDTAKWPQSAIWDTGFDMTTKNALLVPMGRRKDIWVALSTQEIAPGVPQNTASDESSIAITLQNAARMYPESEYYGTKTCRAIVVGHSGELTSSTWRGLAPMTIDLAAKVATYMGASNGAWKPGFNFDISPKNMVTMFRTDSINAAFKTADVRNDDWANGLIWVQNFDRRSLFYPGIQTVYDDDTSVLNSLFNIIAVCELEKVCERVWRELTGIQTLTVAQFIERSDTLITQKVANRFDDKFIIVPETYLTEGDEQRGFSWSCKVNMYAANMRTVGTYTIVSRRIEDYQP